MPHYRIYALSDGGSIVGGTDVECEDDLDAVAIAKLAPGDLAGIEIWSGARLVRQLRKRADRPSGIYRLDRRPTLQSQRRIRKRLWEAKKGHVAPVFGVFPSASGAIWGALPWRSSRPGHERTILTPSLYPSRSFLLALWPVRALPTSGSSRYRRRIPTNQWRHDRLGEVRSSVIRLVPQTSRQPLAGAGCV